MKYSFSLVPPSHTILLLFLLQLWIIFFCSFVRFFFHFLQWYLFVWAPSSHKIHIIISIFIPCSLSRARAIRAKFFLIVEIVLCLSASLCSVFLLLLLSAMSGWVSGWASVHSICIFILICKRARKWKKNRIVLSHFHHRLQYLCAADVDRARWWMPNIGRRNIAHLFRAVAAFYFVQILLYMCVSINIYPNIQTCVL